MNRSLVFPFFALIVLLPFGALDAQTASPLDAARVALKANDLPAAAALLEPLTTGAEATDAAAFHVLSQVRLAQKKIPEAVTLAERATTLDPKHAEYFSQLGLALSRRMVELPFMQQATLASKLRKAFAKAVELDPNDMIGLIGLARFYSNAPEIAGGSLVKAGEFAVRVQRLDPFLGEIELGNIAERDENYAAALEHYEAAVKLKPQHPNSRYLAGRMLVKLGRAADARAQFETALKSAPDFEAAKQDLAALDAPAH